MNLKISILLVLICLSQSCTEPVDDSQPKESNSIALNEEPKPPDESSVGGDTDTSASIHIAGEEVVLEDVEAGVESAIEITETIVEAGTKMLEAKRRNDSVKLSRREKMLAYQLGISIKSEKLVLDAYNNLNDKEGVYAFKKSRREYLLVKYQQVSEEDLDRELENYKAQNASVVIGEIKKIDLVRECGKRKAPRLTNKLKSRRNNIQLDCLTCK